MTLPDIPGAGDIFTCSPTRRATLEEFPAWQVVGPGRPTRRLEYLWQPLAHS